MGRTWENLVMAVAIEGLMADRVKESLPSFVVTKHCGGCPQTHKKPVLFKNSQPGNDLVLRCTFLTIIIDRASVQ